jgi:hypothetical protein
VLIGVAMLTVVLSWTVLNMVSTLRYADQHRGSGRAGIDVGDSNAEEPRVARLRPRRLHNRHVLPGVRHQVAESADSPHGALPSLTRTFSAGRSSVPRSISLRPDSLIIDLCGAQGCAYSSTEAAFSRM